MKVNVIRSSTRTVITHLHHSGGGQSLRELIGEVTAHSEWIVEWEDSKPVSNHDEKALKKEMMQLAKEAGLI